MKRGARTAVAALLAAAAGGAALGSGLDRMSAKNPALTELVPAPFRATAWRQASAASSARGDLPAAQAAAEVAVRRDPLDAAAASALGTARLALRDGAGAAAAFRVAGQLGWRDSPTQLYWMVAATGSGDFAIAAQRADALLRQDPRLRDQPLVLAGLERLAPGRSALAARLALRPEWFADYWNKLYPLNREQLIARARVLDEAALQPARMNCGEVKPIASALLAQRRIAQGQQILSRYCGAVSRPLLADGGFERARLADASPFGWQFTGAGGLDVRLEPRAGFSGQGVVIDTALAMREVFASQQLQLAPGRYRLSWLILGEERAGAPRIVARVACQQGVGAFLAAAPAGRERPAAAFEIAPDCPLQWLDLAIEPGESAVAVDDVAIIPAD